VAAVAPAHAGHVHLVQRAVYGFQVGDHVAGPEAADEPDAGRALALDVRRPGLDEDPLAAPGQAQDTLGNGR